MKEGVAIFRMIYDKNGREIDLFLIDINPTIEKHFKASGKDIRGKKLSKILNKKDIPFLNICKRVIKSGVPESFEDHSINPDKFYKISIIPGQNDFFAVIFDDISQSKQHEEDLRLSEEKYRLIVENANDGILISQSDEFIYNNTKFADILGYHPYEFEHISFKEIYTKEGILDLLDRNHKREKGEKVPNYYETTFKKKDGSVIKVDVNYQIINYRNMPATFAIVRDITQQEQAKKDIQNALKKAEESDRLKSAFLANMSHEIRTPMNGIMGFSKLLRKKDISSEKHKEYLDVIEHSSNRMLNLINDLIDISKLEAGQVRVYNSLFNVSNLFDYLESFFSPECKAKKIKLKKYCNNKLSIYTDKDKLEAVLSNLIKNAIKFTDQGQIKFACEKKFDSLLFYVEDTGIGIPEDKQNEIFSRFVQADDRISIVANEETGDKQYMMKMECPATGGVKYQEVSYSAVSGTFVCDPSKCDPADCDPSKCDLTKCDITKCKSSTKGALTTKTAEKTKAIVGS